MDLKVVPLNSGNKDDFYAVHSKENGHDWCCCVAWWTPTWGAWNQRTPEENKKLREQLFDSNIYDGYLMYDGDKPIGWCQCCSRNLLFKLTDEYNLESDPEAYAITCFVIAPSYREIGLGHFLLDEVLKDLKKRGIKYVQAFPRRGEKLAAENLWTGPEKFFQKAEFVLEKDDPKYPVYSKRVD